MPTRPSGVIERTVGQAHLVAPVCALFLATLFSALTTSTERACIKRGPLDARTRPGVGTQVVTAYKYVPLPLLRVRRAVTAYATPASVSCDGGSVFVTVYVIGPRTFRVVGVATYAYDAVANVSRGRIRPPAGTL